MDKYAVAIFQEQHNYVVHYLPFGHSRMFAKTIFYVLKVGKENSCKVIIHGKAVNQNDRLVMRVPPRLTFTS